MERAGAMNTCEQLYGMQWRLRRLIIPNGVWLRRETRSGNDVLAVNCNEHTWPIGSSNKGNPTLSCSGLAWFGAKNTTGIKTVHI